MHSDLIAISDVCRLRAGTKREAKAEFSELVGAKPTRMDAASKFMSLMLFAKAGAVELLYKEEEKMGNEGFKEIMIQMKN